MTSFLPPAFKDGEEVTVKGTCTEDGIKYTFGALGFVRETRHSYKRGWYYAVELHDGKKRWFYEKSVEKYKPKFIISSIL